MILFVKGSVKSLRSYNGEDIVLTLPGGKTLKDIRYLYFLSTLYHKTQVQSTTFYRNQLSKLFSIHNRAFFYISSDFKCSNLNKSVRKICKIEKILKLIEKNFGTKRMICGFLLTIFIQKKYTQSQRDNYHQIKHVCILVESRR